MCNEKYSFSAGLPYPPVMVEGENLEYAKLIFPAYAGIVSEFSAVSQYFYQHLITESRYECISKALAGISRTEMTHLEILGEILTKLGADPQILAPVGNRLQFWNGGYLNYEKNINKILDLNIEGEKMAIRDYENIIRRVNDRYIRDSISVIIADEKHHIKVLEDLKKELENM